MKCLSLLGYRQTLLWSVYSHLMLSHFVSDMRDVYKISVMSIECSNLDMHVWIFKFFQGQNQVKRSSRSQYDLQAAPIERKNRKHMQSPLQC